MAVVVDDGAVVVGDIVAVEAVVLATVVLIAVVSARVGAGGAVVVSMPVDDPFVDSGVTVVVTAAVAGDGSVSAGSCGSPGSHSGQFAHADVASAPPSPIVVGEVDSTNDPQPPATNMMAIATGTATRRRW